jgi:hypothetical protein
MTLINLEGRTVLRLAIQLQSSFEDSETLVADVAEVGFDRLPHREVDELQLVLDRLDARGVAAIVL